MSDTPQGKISGSPEIFHNIRCNLDSKFIESRDSLKADCLYVFARVRPLLPHEIAKGYQVCVAAIDEQTVRVVVPNTSAKYKSSRQTEEIIEDYTFTAAFGPEIGQFVFFQETMQNIMSNFIEGSNSLIFSYGITGSGKTYTLQGNSENPGIIPLSLKLFFAVTERQLMKNILLKPYMYSDVIQLSDSEKEKELSKKEHLLSTYDEECEAAPGSFRNNNEKSFAMMLCNLFSDDFEAEQRQTTLCAEDMASAQAATLLKEVMKKCADNQPGICSVWVSFIEIYNEVIFDLLQPVSNQRSKLNLGEDKKGNVYVKGATEICVSNSEEALKILNIGRKHLSIASTKLNYQSSRSHCIYTIRIVRLPDEKNMSQVRVSRLSFCDLAGSERTSKTQTTGARFKEATAINTSLLVLGRCLEHLHLNQTGRDKRLIPFRESKLTRIFSGFFLGQGRAAMIANASPSDYTFDETLHVLKFSAVAKKILINDTFLSNASSTIQSICNQWEMCKANISTCNESMESIESDDSLIREKDELIEKLLNLAKNFAEKEKEMNGLEMHIRREVCQEYAEVREEFLAAQKLRYEEEMAAIKAAYEKRLTKRKEMYENIINGFKEQLSESNESMLSDKSLDDSKSFEMFNNSERLSLSKSDSPQLNKELEEKTTELDSLRKELQNKQSILNDLRHMHEELTLKIVDITSDNENLKKELASETEKNLVLKSNVESLQNEIQELKTLKASDEEKIENYKVQIDNLIKRIEIDAREYAATKKQMESKLEAQLQEETRQFIDKINLLEEEIETFKTAKTSYEKDIQNLEGKLSESQEENNKSEKIIHDQCETISTLENEIENLEKNLAELKKSKDALEMELEKEKSRYKKEISEAKNALKEYTNFQILYHSDLEKKNEKIASLEQELQAANKNCDMIQKELKLRDKVSMELEKEIDAFKQTIDKLQKEIHESVSSKFELEKKASMLRDELKLSQENSQKLSSALEKIENKNIAYKLEIQNLLKKESLEDPSRVITLEKQLSNLENEITTLREANKRITDNLMQLEDTEQKLKFEEEKYKRLEDECIKLKELNKNIKSEKLNVEKELSSTKDRMENMHRMIKKHEQDLQIWKQEKLSLDTEKKELKEKVIIANDNIKCLEKEIQEKSSKILELEYSNKKCDMDNAKLRQDELSAQKKEFEEKLTYATNTMKSMEQNLHEKASKISELESQINMYKVEVLNLKDEYEQLESENLELKSEIDSYKEKIKGLEDNLTSTFRNLNSVQEANQKSAEIEKEINIYKHEMANLKECLEFAQNEKNDLLVTISEKDKRIADIEAQLCSVKDHLETTKNDLNEKNLQLKNLKDDASLTAMQLQEKITQLETNKKALEVKESEFNALKKEHEQLKCNFENIFSEKEHLQNNLDSERQNLAQLEKEIKARESELESFAKMLKKNELELNAFKDKSEQLSLKIRKLESANSNLEKKITENEDFFQEKLKTAKASYEAKMLMEKEQHTIEIEETMKLKREVEKENEKLKEDNIKYKENIKLLKEELESLEQKKQPEKNKKEILSKAIKKIETKETGAKSRITKATNKKETKETGKTVKAAKKNESAESNQSPRTSRTLRKKELVYLNESSSSSIEVESTEPADVSKKNRKRVESTEPADVSKKNRKRVSDEDFDPTKERASKRMKPNEESSKIPVKRTSRRKLVNDQVENLSPVQKIANSISTKFKAVAENVSSRIASPRLTRGRKKLYNPDSGVPSKAEKVTRGKK